MKNSYAVSKNVKFDKWKPVQGNFLSETAPTPTPLAVPEEVMPDVEESKVKKSIERKKHFYIVNVLKESVRATTITKRILDLGINFTVGKLLAFAPAVEK